DTSPAVSDCLVAHETHEKTRKYIPNQSSQFPRGENSHFVSFRVFRGQYCRVRFSEWCGWGHPISAGAMSSNDRWAAYACVQVVGSFEELVTTPFAGEVNALCWARELRGDFAEVAAQVVAIGGGDGVTTLDEEDLMALTLGPGGQQARTELIAD